MRNALGHEGEFYSTTEARTKHSGNKNMFLEFIIAGESYSIESFGRRLSLDLSKKAGQKLERIKLLIVESIAAALVPETVATSQLGRAELAKDAEVAGFLTWRRGKP